MRQKLFLVTLGAGVIFAAVVAFRLDFNNSPTREPVKQPGSHFFKPRAFPQGKIDLSALAAARNQTRQMRDVLAGDQPIWQQRGPNNIQGRVTDLAVDPNNDNIAYAAAAEGGVFRTADGGASWTALFDEMPSLSVGAVSIDPSNPNVILAGTGEVNPGGGSVAYGGTGLYRSNDQGQSWTLLGLANSGSIGRIVVHPRQLQHHPRCRHGPFVGGRAGPGCLSDR